MLNVSQFQQKSQKIHYGRGCSHTDEFKSFTISLLEEGNSFRAAGRIVGVSHQTISKWVKEYAQTLPEPKVSTMTSAVEVDELCTFIKKK